MTPGAASGELELSRVPDQMAWVQISSHVAAVPPEQADWCLRTKL